MNDYFINLFGYRQGNEQQYPLQSDPVPRPEHPAKPALAECDDRSLELATGDQAVRETVFGNLEVNLILKPNDAEDERVITGVPW